MKNVLVTGGAGFIGSHLCRRLLEEGNRVTCLDNFFTGRRENIAGMLEHPDFVVLRRNVTKPLSEPFDEIYNLACPASPPHYQHYPTETTKTSVIGMINMLELANRFGTKVLQASTSEVYGDPEVHPQTESYRGSVSITGPRACYDEGKRVAETLCYDYLRQFGTKVKVVRIFNTYGPNMAADDGRVVSNFILQALRGQDITIYGDGSQTRSFCYVDDLVEGLVRMMESRDDFHGPVNLGNPGEFTIKELAGKVTELTGSRSQVVYEPLPQDDPVRRRPDISLAKRELGWEPHIPLEDGLERTIAYFRGQM